MMDNRVYVAWKYEDFTQSLMLKAFEANEDAALFLSQQKEEGEYWHCSLADLVKRKHEQISRCC